MTTSPKKSPTEPGTLVGPPHGNGMLRHGSKREGASEDHTIRLRQAVLWERPPVGRDAFR